MIYADLPAGATVFLDASVSGVTATHIVSEVAHRLMTIEAMQAFGWKSAGIALRLRNHPAQVQPSNAFVKPFRKSRFSASAF
jgi:hypothetical protein